MLALRSALKAALGSSFSVTHAGPAGSVSVTVGVGDALQDDAALALPCVFVVSQVGSADGANIGGGAVRNDAFCDLSIETLDGDEWDGPLLLDDIHAKVETLIRAVEKTLGSSYYSLVSSYRDFPPEAVAGVPVYRRVVTVRAVNYQSY